MHSLPHTPAEIQVEHVAEDGASGPGTEQGPKAVMVLVSQRGRTLKLVNRKRGDVEKIRTITSHTKK